MNNRNPPVLICNNTKENIENEKLFNRNFCTLEDKEYVLDFKPNSFICQEYKTINNYRPVDIKNKIDTCGIENVTNNCEPDRGNYLNYLRNIDIDTELKQINRKNSKCPEDDYLNPKLARMDRNNKNLINSNQRLPYRFNYELEPQRFVRSNVNYNPRELDECKKRDLYDTGNCKTFNYDVDLSYNKCATLNSDVNVCSDFYKNINEPYLHWTKNNKCNSNAMEVVVGPKRKDHNCENIFNNNTKRGFMTCDKPWAHYTNTAPDFSKNSVINYNYMNDLNFNNQIQS